MNKVQRDRLLAIIDKDAEIAGQYRNTEGQMCIIGGIFNEIVPKALDYIADEHNGDGILSLPEADIIVENFGLSYPQILQLQEINDAHQDRPRRQTSLAEYVNSIPVEDDEKQEAAL